MSFGTRHRGEFASEDKRCAFEVNIDLVRAGIVIDLFRFLSRKVRRKIGLDHQVHCKIVVQRFVALHQFHQPFEADLIGRELANVREPLKDPHRTRFIKVDQSRMLRFASRDNFRSLIEGRLERDPF